MAGLETLRMLGEDRVAHGGFACASIAGGRTAGALSAGASPDVPGAALKVDPNEDALVASDDTEAVLLAVADAHWGRLSSHVLLSRLAERLAPPVPDVETLARQLDGLGTPPVTPADPSETTLLVVAYDRREGAGFGISYGDSTALLLEAGEPARAFTEKVARYVSAARPASLGGPGVQRFFFEARPGGLLVLFTDGVDECHYGHPETSVRPWHLEALFREVGADAAAFAHRLAELALTGVDGHPGGEDNLALVVART